MLSYKRQRISRERINSVILDVKNNLTKYPNTDLWWFGSSVKKGEHKVRDIDFAIISTSEDELCYAERELRTEYPTGHFDHARIYTKSRHDKFFGEPPIHFIFCGPDDVSSNVELEQGIRNGVRIISRDIA